MPEILLEKAPLLGVEKSFTGRRWQEALGDQRMAQAISQRLDLPEIVGRVMAARGIGLDDAASYLTPTLRDLLPDPASLRDMNSAAERIAGAIQKNQIIGIFGDYDVDGATSSALLIRFLHAVGARHALYIPDRIKEGYGPNTGAMLALKAQGANVVITVDCGTLAFQPLEVAAAEGMDVIVVDHHAAEPQLPRAFAVINPNRLDELGGLGHLAAVGVAFLMVVAVNRHLRAAGWYKSNVKEPDLMGWLDIVALGTVCDVVPLVGLNRALVTQGLKIMALRRNAGLVALADVAGFTEAPDAYHLGYLLGPRVNAGGRVGKSDLGALLLSTDDPAEAVDIARLLDGFNSERQGLEADMLLQAIAQVDGRADDGLSVIMAAGEGWHQGVVGIIAGRLKERYGRPACAIALLGDIGTGSGRSIPGRDLGAAIIAARQAGLLLKGGGHAMAAGFTVARENIGALHVFLAARLADGAEGRTVPSLELDGAIDLAGANVALAESLRRLGPFGSGNREPRFAISAARVTAPRVVGSGHVSCQLVGQGGTRLRAIAFRAADSELGRALLAGDGTPLHLAGTLRLDAWQGVTRVQLFIEDGAPIRG